MMRRRVRGLLVAVAVLAGTLLACLAEHWAIARAFSAYRYHRVQQVTTPLESAVVEDLCGKLVLLAGRLAMARGPSADGIARAPSPCQ